MEFYKKRIEAFLHPIDAYKGLKAKYLVFKADTGERVDNCFILRPDKDAAAVEALRAYAKVTDNETLAKDIYNWVGNGVTVREPNTILTLHGYNAEALVLVAEMLRKHLITEDELDNFFKDFTKMYEVIIREQKTIISEAMATFEWPSVGEVVEMMWNERNCGADMREKKGKVL